MIPSVQFRSGIVVVYEWQWSAKRDALGRRIRGTTRLAKFIGYRCFRREVDRYREIGYFSADSVGSAREAAQKMEGCSNTKRPVC